MIGHSTHFIQGRRQNMTSQLQCRPYHTSTALIKQNTIPSPTPVKYAECVWPAVSETDLDVKTLSLSAQIGKSQ